MPLTDLAVLLTLGIATPVVVLLLRRRGLRGRRLFTAGWLGFYALVLVVSMAAHSVDIVWRLFVGRGYDGAATAYDFRVYSLVLLGAVLIGFGVRLLMATRELGRGLASARSGAAWTTLLALAVVAPLIPIQPVFAIPLTVLSALTLLVLAWAGAPPERAEPEPPAPPAPERRPAGMTAES